jgi:hypothetical protein
MSDKKETIISAGGIPAMLMRLPKGMYKVEITPVDNVLKPELCLPSQDPKYYIETLAKQVNFCCNDTITLCKKINDVSPGALMSMLLMTIAKELDLNHAGHISTCSEVYVYSTVNGKIGVISTKNISKASFKYFAAFRSKEEAVFAIKMVNAIKTFINEH